MFRSKEEEEEEGEKRVVKEREEEEEEEEASLHRICVFSVFQSLVIDSSKLRISNRVARNDEIYD